MALDLTLAVADSNYSITDTVSNFGFAYAPEATDSLTFTDVLGFVYTVSGGGIVFISDALSLNDAVASTYNVAAAPADVGDTSDIYVVSDDVALLMQYLLN